MLYPTNLKIMNPVSLGGNVVAILYRQSVLGAAIARAAYDKARFFGTAYGSAIDFVRNPSNVNIITGVPITTRLQEAYSFPADITQHAVEGGIIYPDHVILHPMRVDLSFEVSNWEGSSPKQSLDQLELIWSSRQPVTLMTEHKKIENMILFDLRAENGLPEWGKLCYRASFQNIASVKLNSTKVSSDSVAATDKTGGPNMSKSLESATVSGKQTPTSLTTKSVDANTFWGTRLQ
jgi:hypothetical protein